MFLLKIAIQDISNNLRIDNSNWKVSLSRSVEPLEEISIESKAFTSKRKIIWFNTGTKMLIS